MEIIIKSVDDVLTQMDAKQLLELKEKLNGLTFVSPYDLVFGCFKKHYYNEIYGWSDGTGHSKSTRKSFSEIFLYNTVTKCDALTGENLDESYQTRVEDMGSMGEIFTFCPSKIDGVWKVTLENEAKQYQLPFQEWYTEYDCLKLYEFYTSWCKIQMDSKCYYYITRSEEKIKLPYRQYEKTEDGAIRALKPLQYF